MIYQRFKSNRERGPQTTKVKIPQRQRETKSKDKGWLAVVKKAHKPKGKCPRSKKPREGIPPARTKPCGKKDDD